MCPPVCEGAEATGGWQRIMPTLYYPVRPSACLECSQRRTSLGLSNRQSGTQSVAAAAGSRRLLRSYMTEIVARASRTESDGVVLITVLLHDSVRRFDHGAVTNAVFGLSECEDLRTRFLQEACRGVPASRLPTVLATGIDVSPPSGPIWVSSLDKAMEYGGWPKALLVLNPSRLDRTFRELPRQADPRAVAEVLKVFPSEIEHVEGDRRWFSRLDVTDPRAGTDYEIAHAKWIPGDPKLALEAVILIHHPRFDGP